MRNQLWNQKIVNEENLIHYYVKLGSVEETLNAIQHWDEDVNFPNKFHQYPLHFAAKDGDAKLVKILLQNGAKINCLSEDKSTPLHYAALNDNPQVDKIEAIKTLLEHGCQVDPKDSYGYTPFNYAVMFHEIEVIEELLNHGANANHANLDQDYFTPIHHIVSRGEIEATKILIEYGANVNAKVHIFFGSSVFT